MSQSTAIEWTDVSWNPVHGCSKVSPGCAHCYAATLSLRYGQTKKPWTPANAAENVMLKPHKLREPLSNAKEWRGLGAAAAAAGMADGKLVFVNSTSDLFHEEVPSTFIIDVFNVMGEARQHTFQILTKRPERMANMLRSWPLREHWPNVWLGVSIENRRFAGRADWLRLISPAVRFISAEPLLGPLVGMEKRQQDYPIRAGRPHGVVQETWRPGLDLTGIDWLIIGGESGPGHRRMDLQRARDLRDAAQHGGTALFVKQLGGARPGTELEDLPADLRVREFPTRAEATA
jgi:protein gp37